MDMWYEGFLKGSMTYKPFDYLATRLTSKSMQNLLPNILEKISKSQEIRGDLIVQSWPEIIGEKLALMTEAISFERATLYVKVKNATLYSLLTQHEKPKLLKALQEKFPRSGIKNIVFKMG